MISSALSMDNSSRLSNCRGELFFAKIEISKNLKKNRRFLILSGSFRVVTSATNWDRCSIGVAADKTPNSAFCGQMGAMYLFGEALSLQQANSLFCLGPAYQSTFKHDSETCLPEGYKKVREEVLKCFEASFSIRVFWEWLCLIKKNCETEKKFFQTQNFHFSMMSSLLEIRIFSFFLEICNRFFFEFLFIFKHFSLIQEFRTLKFRNLEITKFKKYLNQLHSQDF